MHKQRIVKNAPILREKLDAERRTVTCMLIAADTPDLHGDIMRPAAITAALDSYMDTSQVVGRMHIAPTASSPRRVWQDSAGNAWTETHVADEADWQAIASGEYTGLSWAGYAYRSDIGGGRFLLTEPEMLEYSFVDKPAVPSAVFKSEDDGEGAGASLAARIASGEVPRRVNSPESGGRSPGGNGPESEVRSLEAGITPDEPFTDESVVLAPEEGQAANDQGQALTADAGHRTPDFTALVAQLTESIAQACALLQPQNVALAKHAPAAPLQPGPTQRIHSDGADITMPVEDKPPAWMR